MAIHSIELCAGVGMLGEGVRAAFDLLGIDHRTVCYVEREAPAAAQLVALMEAGAIDPAPVWSDLLTFRGAAWSGCVDFIVAGFPCQDISVAGKRAGLDGKRSGLFFDILDIADECDAWGLVLENVGGIATATATVVDEAEGTLEERAAARVVGELADRGWDAEWITLSASDVGANHGRLRWFCIAWRRMADPGHRSRAHQSLGFGGLSGSADYRPSGETMEPPDCARWETTGRRSEVHARGEPQSGCGSMDDAHHPVSQGRGLPASEWQGRVDSGRPSQGHDNPLDDPDCAGLATVDEHGRCVWIVADAQGDGRYEGRPESGGKQGRSDVAQCSRSMAHASQPRLPHAEQPGEPQAYGRRAAPELCGTPLFAPGPLDPRWAAIVANRPDLAPAVEPGIRMLADGMAYLVDESRAHQLRQVGNGVVPLQAACAVVELLRRVGAA